MYMIVHNSHHVNTDILCSMNNTVYDVKVVVFVFCHYILYSTVVQYCIIIFL